MGTRHLIEVKHNDQIKIAQYGQWDGYPSGQGRTIAEFLHEIMDKPKFKEALDKTAFMTKEDIEAFNNREPKTTLSESHPWLSRDAGAKILDMVQNGLPEGAKLYADSEFKKDTLMCEYAYLIDMDNETVSVSGRCGEHTLPFPEWTKEKMDSLENSDDEEAA